MYSFMNETVCYRCKRQIEDYEDVCQLENRSYCTRCIDIVLGHGKDDQFSVSGDDLLVDDDW